MAGDTDDNFTLTTFYTSWKAYQVDPARFPWLGAEDFPLTGAALFGHFHEEHEPDMRAWLARIRREERQGEER